jgi:hypothetical protein
VRRVDRLLIWVTVAYSGFFVMSLEMLAGRLLAPVFGADIFVWGAVISVFMIGLSLGYGLGGAWSTDKRSPARLGALSACTGAAALLTALATPAVCDFFGGAVSDIRLGAFCAALSLFVLPSMSAGATTPYCVALIVKDLATAGRSAGILSFVSTAGSAVGVLLTSFVLILYFEVTHILIAMAIGAIVLGLILVARGRLRGEGSA